MKTLSLSAAALISVGLVGCGPSRSPMFHASGEVVFQGKPLAHAGVMCCPAGGRPAAAPTDDHGRFTLRTWTAADGAVEGEHVVCVTKFVADAAEAADSLYPQGKNMLPEQYASPLTSPLRVIITRKGPNTFRFELE